MTGFLPDIPAFIEAHGYFAIWLLAWVETVFPVFPLEVILPLGALAASHGKLSLWGVALAGTMGSMTGAVAWYVLARCLGFDRLTALVTRHGRWTTLSPASMARLLGWFERFGSLTVFGGRLVPGLRSAVSIPAGIAKMPFLPFFAWSIAGVGLWASLLTWGGWALRNQMEMVQHWLSPAIKLMIVGLALLWLYRVITWREPDMGA